MRHKYLLIILVLLFSCKSTNMDIADPVNFKIWMITDYTTGDIQFFPEIVKEAYLIKNLDTNKVFVQFILSDERTSELETLWKKRDKKLKLNEVFLIQEVTYKQEKSTLTITSVKTDYVLKGENTNKITEQINNIVLTERAGESFGIFALLYRIWNPDIISTIPFPQINRKDTFTIEYNGGILKASNDSTSISLKDEGIQEWIGY